MVVVIVLIIIMYSFMCHFSKLEELQIKEQNSQNKLT